MATFTSRNGKHRVNISTINTHLAVFHECGFEFTTQKRRRKNAEWWNPFSWGGGFEWVNKNNALQPADIELRFFMGNGDQRNPNDFNLTETTNTGYFKESAVSANVTNAGANDVSWISRVELSFQYDGTPHTL